MISELGDYDMTVQEKTTLFVHFRLSTMWYSLN